MANNVSRGGNGLTLVGAGAVVLAVIYFIAFICCWCGIGYKNAVTPPGYAGYVIEGAVTGQSKYLGVQVGPTSSGAGWLRQVTNIPITPRTYEEDFSGNNGILSSDNTRVSFAVDVMWKIKTGDAPDKQPWIKVFAEQYATLHPGDDPETIMSVAYNNNLKGKIQALVRQSAESHSGMTVQDNMQKIADDVREKVGTLTANSPFEIMNVTVGRIHLPKQVTDQIANNLIAAQQTAQSKIKIDLTTKQAEINRIDSEALAQAADIVNRSMTKCWVQFQMIKALEANVHSSTPTTIYVPSGPGGLPDVAELEAQNNCK